MWLPGSDWFKKWWNQFLGWNVFGPLYLFVLIFGMTFLVRRGDLMLYIMASGGQVDLSTILLENIFFFIFTLIIFVGGLGLALNSSFATAVKSTAIVGAAAQRLGAFGALTLSRRIGGAAARGAYRVSGAQATAETGAATFQAARERARQEYERRRPEALRMKTMDERLATAQRRLGVYGGAQAEYKKVESRIGAAKTDLANKVATIQGTADMSAKERQTEYLQGLMNTGNKATRLAARQMLIERGKLKLPDIRKTAEMYDEGLQRNEFSKTVEKSAAKDPETILQYMAGHEGYAEGSDDYKKLESKYYGSVLNNPEAFAKLDDDYFKKGTKQYDKVKEAVDRRYPKERKGSAKAREAAMGRMLGAISSPKQAEAIYDLFGGEEGGGGPSGSPGSMEQAVRERQRRNQEEIRRQGGGTTSPRSGGTNIE
jgi:hypothetical protein